MTLHSDRKFNFWLWFEFYYPQMWFGMPHGVNVCGYQTVVKDDPPPQANLCLSGDFLSHQCIQRLCRYRDKVSRPELGQKRRRKWSDSNCAEEQIFPQTISNFDTGCRYYGTGNSAFVSERQALIIQHRDSMPLRKYVQYGPELTANCFLCKIC